MNQRVNILASEPQIERDIGMPGGAREIVILRVPIADIAALGLHRNNRLAAPNRGETEHPVVDLWIILDRAPGTFKILLQHDWKLLQRSTIFGKAKDQRLLAERISQRTSVLDIETGRAEIAQQRLDRGQRVEPHRMRDLMRTAGIARQDDGKPLLARRRA